MRRRSAARHARMSFWRGGSNLAMNPSTWSAACAVAIADILPGATARSPGPIIIFTNPRILRTGDAATAAWPENERVMTSRNGCGGLERILLVTDDAAERRLFAGKLRSAEFSVTEASGSPEALDLLRRMRFRVLVLDLDMAESDGFHL